MNKTKDNASATIETGKPIKIEADTRADAAAQIADLRKQAAEAGLTEAAGGFIEYCKRDYLDKGRFCATVTFNKL